MNSTSGSETDPPAVRSGTFALGGDLPVHRLGFGAMQHHRPRRLGPAGRSRRGARRPAPRRRARHQSHRHRRLLRPRRQRRADRRGAPSLSEGPGDRHEGRFRAHRPRNGSADGRPEHLRAGLRGQPAPAASWSASISGSSTASIPKVPRRISSARCATLQQRGEDPPRRIVGGDGRADRGAPQVLRRRLGAEPLQPGRPRVREGARLLRPREHRLHPLVPAATGNLAKPGGPLARMAERHGATPAQIALAWLLSESPVMLPIPGTSKVKHLEENTAAALLALDDSTMAELERARP